METAVKGVEIDKHVAASGSMFEQLQQASDKIVGSIESALADGRPVAYVVQYGGRRPEITRLSEPMLRLFSQTSEIKLTPLYGYVPQYDQQVVDDLVNTASRVLSKYGIACDWTEWVDLSEALQRAKDRFKLT